MPPSDLPALVHRTREAVTHLLQIAWSGAADPTLISELEDLSHLVARLANEVQCGLLQQRRPARLPRSSDIDHGVHIERFTPAGDRSAEQPHRKRLSGNWNPGGRRRD